MKRRAVGARHSTLPLYLGGFLGPFGGSMLIPLIPTIADDLETSVGLVAASITAYMIPFAALQFFSGTLSERVGGGRVVRAGYFAYACAALLCALAPDVGVLLGARALMGAANAFLSPILLAALSETVPAGVLGRSVGTFAAAQTAGVTIAPVLGGALGEVSWRLPFVLVVVLSLLLALPRLEVGRRTAAKGGRATLRVLLNRWFGLLSIKAVAGYLGFTGIGFVVALLATDEFGLGSGATGLVVAAYGLGGILFGRLAGSVADRVGRPPTALAGALVCACTVLGLAFASTAWGLALIFFATGCAGTLVWAGLNTIAIESFPENRAGAISAYSAFKYIGLALAPLVYVPLFHANPQAPFFLASGFTLLVAALVVPWFARYPR